MERARRLATSGRRKAGTALIGVACGAGGLLPYAGCAGGSCASCWACAGTSLLALLAALVAGARGAAGTRRGRPGAVQPLCEGDHHGVA